MLKNILKLEGAKKLTAQEIKEVKGSAKVLDICYIQCGPTGGVYSTTYKSCICY